MKIKAALYNADHLEYSGVWNRTYHQPITPPGKDEWLLSEPDQKRI